MTEEWLHKLSTIVGEKLKIREEWITCAESCTGGWVAKAITDVAGCSSYFERGFVTYSNAAKQKLLGVKESTLMTYGAVSKEVVREMAVGALHAAAANVALSTSGIVGPDGGSIDNPVGAVWFGFASDIGRVETCKKIFVGDRRSVRLQATIFSLQIILNNFLEK